MQNFKAPERDTLFVTHELLDMQSHYQALGFDEVSEDLVRAIYAEAGKFAENVLAPINAIGDQEGCKIEDGVVTTPSGFKEAYAQYVEGGWTSMAHPESFNVFGCKSLLGDVSGLEPRVHGNTKKPWHQRAAGLIFN